MVFVVLSYEDKVLYVVDNLENATWKTRHRKNSYIIYRPFSPSIEGTAYNFKIKPELEWRLKILSNASHFEDDVKEKEERDAFFETLKEYLTWRDRLV